MSHWFRKPENALKRAHELLNLANDDLSVIKRQKTAALQILHDTITSKKNTKNWSPIHEEMMFLYINICIDLQLGRIAKDGLHQYRNLTLAQNPKSLEKVLKHFLLSVEQKTADARKHSTAINLSSCASLDEETASPESSEAIMLSTTTQDNYQDRTDREIVLPWLRFLWETYRTILDILRCNTKFTNLYHDVAVKSFTFCVQYERKLEFRRLADILRTHLSNIQRHMETPTAQSARQMRAWEGWSQESIDNALTTRYKQLESAITLELWTEGFRTIDDIHSVMEIIPQQPKTSLMATYYEKLTEIFWVSKNYLFHAFAWYKFYLLSKNHNLSLTAAKKQELASCVVLACLSIPLADGDMSAEFKQNSSSIANDGSAVEFDIVQKEKNQRMSQLLGFTVTPTRAKLLFYLKENNILADCFTCVQEIYSTLEKCSSKSDPATIISTVKPLFAELGEKDCPAEILTKYVNMLEKCVVKKVLLQLTRVYSTVTLAYLTELFKPLNIDFHEIECLIVQTSNMGVQRSCSTIVNQSESSSNNNSNHHEKLLSILLNNNENVGKFPMNVQIDHRQKCIHFSLAQDLESVQSVQQQISLLGSSLTHVFESKIKTNWDSSDMERTELFEASRSKLSEEHAKMLSRKVLIEKRKEEFEQLLCEKEKQTKLRKGREEEVRRQNEKKRLEEEARKREQLKKKKIQDEIAKKEKLQILTRFGITDSSDKNVDEIDQDKLIRDAREEAKKKILDQKRKLKEQSKRLDYLTRALRETEQPILEKIMARERKEFVEEREREQKERAEAHHKAYVSNLALKERFTKSNVASLSTEFSNAQMEKMKETITLNRQYDLIKRFEYNLKKANDIIKKEEDAENRRIAELKKQEEEEKLEQERLRELEEKELQEEIKRQEAADAKEKRDKEEAAKQAEADKTSSSESGWTSVRSTSSRASRDEPAGPWRRAGRTERDAPQSERRSGGVSAAFGGNRDRDGPYSERRIERDQPERRSGGVSAAFGGNRDRDGFSDRRPGAGGAFGGNRDDRWRGDRNNDRGFSRGGGDRDNARFGGDRDRGSDRFGADRGGDRFSDRFGDRSGSRGGDEGSERRGPGGASGSRGNSDRSSRGADNGRWR